MYYMFYYSKRSGGEIRDQNAPFVEPEMEVYDKHAPKSATIFGPGNKKAQEVPPEIWWLMCKEPCSSLPPVFTAGQSKFPLLLS